MSGGIVARSVVFDELVSDFIRKNPDCTVVNIACVLDTRFYRMDNGKITWYNLDLPETIEVRDSIYQESGRVSTIACSVLDPAWADQVKVRGKMLFIIEGLTMYMKADEVRMMLAIIRDHFDNAYVCMETLNPIYKLVMLTTIQSGFFRIKSLTSSSNTNSQRKFWCLKKRKKRNEKKQAARQRKSPKSFRAGNLFFACTGN